MISRLASSDHGDLMRTTPAAMNEFKDEDSWVLQLEVHERPCKNVQECIHT